MNWNEMDVYQRRKAVKDLIDAGMVARKIAEELNATRASIIGFCFRQKITLPNSRGPIKTKNKKGIKEIALIERRAVRPPAHKLKGNTEVKEVMKIDARSDAEPVPFIEALDRGLCKWPLWTTFEGPDTSMCCGGERIEGRPYCEFHEDLHRGIGTLSERRADEVLERHVEA